MVPCARWPTHTSAITGALCRSCALAHVRYAALMPGHIYFAFVCPLLPFSVPTMYQVVPLHPVSRSSGCRRRSKSSLDLGYQTYSSLSSGDEAAAAQVKADSGMSCLRRFPLHNDGVAPHILHGHAVADALAGRRRSRCCRPSQPLPPAPSQVSDASFDCSGYSFPAVVAGHQGCT